ncbi:hypothetical protein HDR58_03220 [bacterium]|nr:hypothetical protein [bacterium]
METKNYIKSILKLNGITIKKLAELLTETTGKKYTQGSLTAKINRDGISFKEASVIAEILGYNLEFIKKN